MSSYKFWKDVLYRINRADHLNYLLILEFLLEFSYNKLGLLL